MPKKDELGHDGEPEHGQGQPRNGDESRQVVRNLIATDGRDHTKWNANERRKNERDHSELEGGRQTAAQVFQDWATGRERGAEVAPGESFHVADVLNG